MGYAFFGIYCVVVLRIVHMVFPKNTGSHRWHFNGELDRGGDGGAVLHGRHNGIDLRFSRIVGHVETLIRKKRGI